MGASSQRLTRPSPFIQIRQARIIYRKDPLWRSVHPTVVSSPRLQENYRARISGGWPNSAPGLLPPFALAEILSKVFLICAMAQSHWLRPT